MEDNVFYTVDNNTVNCSLLIMIMPTKHYRIMKEVGMVTSRNEIKHYSTMSLSYSTEPQQTRNDVEIKLIHNYTDIILVNPLMDIDESTLDYIINNNMKRYKSIYIVKSQTMRLPRIYTKKQISNFYHVRREDIEMAKLVSTFCRWIDKNKNNKCTVKIYTKSLWNAYSFHGTERVTLREFIVRKNTKGFLKEYINMNRYLQSIQRSIMHYKKNDSCLFLIPNSRLVSSKYKSDSSLYIPIEDIGKDYFGLPKFQYKEITQNSETTGILGKLDWARDGGADRFLEYRNVFNVNTQTIDSTSFRVDKMAIKSILGYIPKIIKNVNGHVILVTNNKEKEKGVKQLRSELVDAFNRSIRRNSTYEATHEGDSVPVANIRIAGEVNEIDF